MYNVQGVRIGILRHKFCVPGENSIFNFQCMVFEEDIHRANPIIELVQEGDVQLHFPLSQC